MTDEHGEERRLREALSDFCSAFEDACRRFYAGDDRAIESYALHATYRDAKRVLGQEMAEK